MMAGGNLYDLKAILGHASVTQTEKYAHFAPDYLAGKTDFLGFAAPAGKVVPLTSGKLSTGG